MGSYAGIDYNLTLLYVHSRVGSNTFNMGNHIPEWTLLPSQGLWIWPLSAFNIKEIYIRTSQMINDDVSFYSSPISFILLKLCIYWPPKYHKSS